MYDGASVAHSGDCDGPAISAYLRLSGDRRAAENRPGYAVGKLLKSPRPRCQADVQSDRPARWATSPPGRQRHQALVPDAGLSRRPESTSGNGSDEDFGEPAPRLRRSKPKRLRKPRGKRKRSLKAAAIIGVPVLGMAGLICGLWWLWGALRADLDLAYLPADADTIRVYRPGDDWDAFVASGALGDADPQDVLRIQRAAWGIAETDVESVTSGTNASGDAIRVVRCKADMQPMKILQHAPEYEEIEYNGERFYRFDGAAIFFPTPRVAVCGTDASVRKAIDRGGDSPARDVLKFVDPRFPDFTIAVHHTAGAAEPVVTVLALRGHKTTGRGVVSFRYPSEAAAEAAATAAKADLAERRKLWTQAGRERAQNLYLRDAALGKSTITKGEVENQVDADQLRVSTTKVKRKGDVVQLMFDWKYSDYEKRLRRERAASETPDAKTIANSLGRRLFLDPVEPAMPDSPLLTRLDEKPKDSPGTGPAAETTVYEVGYQSFSRIGSAKSMILTALRHVPGIDISKTVVDIKQRRIVVCSLPDAEMRGQSISVALRDAGFKLVTVQKKKNTE